MEVAVPLLLLLAIVLSIVALFLVRWLVALFRPSRRSWASLVGRLRPDWTNCELNDCFEWDRCIVETPENIWEVMKGPKGLWVMYCNAGVMLEMVDYAVRHGANVDRGLVDGIRRAASSIRSCALKALGHYAVTYAWDTIYDNAFLAASQYLEVIRRMQELLLAAGLVEEFMAT